MAATRMDIPGHTSTRTPMISDRISRYQLGFPQVRQQAWNRGGLHCRSLTQAPFQVQGLWSDVCRARFLGKQFGWLFGCLAADQIPRAHWALALDVDATALLQHKLVLEARIHRVG